ncbi:MAG: hypothetical protein IPK58_01515 [Acidobacteria bacterium]|nr:hypothetical protein [Acidobacteriota bacterium]
MDFDHIFYPKLNRGSFGVLRLNQKPNNRTPRKDHLKIPVNILAARPTKLANHPVLKIIARFSELIPPSPTINLNPRISLVIVLHNRLSKNDVLALSAAAGGLSRISLIVFEGMITFTVSCPGPNIVLPDAISKPIIGSYLFQVSESVESLVRSVRRKLSRCIFRSPSIVLSRKEQIAFRRLTCHSPRNRPGKRPAEPACPRDVFGHEYRTVPAVDVVAVDRLSETAADAEQIDKPADDAERPDRLNAKPSL